MAYGLSPYLANKLLDHVRGVAYTAPTGIYARLHTGDPGVAGTANLAVGDTTRKAVTFGAAAGGVIAQSGTSAAWVNTTATTETVRAVSFWDAATGGNLLWTREAPASKTWSENDTLTFAGGSFALTPLAA